MKPKKSMSVAPGCMAIGATGVLAAAIWGGGALGLSWQLCAFGAGLVIIWWVELLGRATEFALERRLEDLETQVGELRQMQGQMSAYLHSIGQEVDYLGTKDAIAEIERN